MRLGSGYDFTKDPNYLRTEKFIPHNPHDNPFTTLLNDAIFTASHESQNAALNGLLKGLLINGLVIPSVATYGVGKFFPNTKAFHDPLINPIQWGEDKVRGAFHKH